MNDVIDCELVWDLPAGLRRLQLRLPCGAKLQAALDVAGQHWKDGPIDWQGVPVGIWGERASRDRSLQPGDRIELYRELLQDPRQARRERLKRRGR